MPTVMIHVVRSHDSLLAFVSPLEKWIWWSVISLGGLCPFEVLGLHLPQCGQGRGLPLYQVASWFIQPFGHNRHGRKLGVLCPLFEGSRVPVYHSVAGAETYSTLSFILIHPTVWPQYSRHTGLTDRQDNSPIAWGKPFCKRSPRNHCISASVWLITTKFSWWRSLTVLTFHTVKISKF